MAALELRSIEKVYDGHRVVGDVSLKVPSGELLSLLGPSGCGKSTTLRIVAGLTLADGGAILVDGRDVTREPAASRRMGMVFQSLALFPHMTVSENIGFGLACRGMTAAQQRPKIGAALEKVRLAGYERRFPGQLSGGQRQRVALARAIVTDPDLLLLDEPFSALDRNLRDEMQQELRDVVHSLGITSLFVTHDQEEAIRLSDRIAVMQGGRIVQVDSPRRIYEHPTTRFVAEFVGSPNMLQVLRSGSRLTTLGGDLIEAETQIAGMAGDGQSLFINVRPERARLLDQEPATGSRLKGVVVSCVYDGAFTTYKIALAHQPESTWIVREGVGHASQPKESGSTVFMSWHDKDCNLIVERR